MRPILTILLVWLSIGMAAAQETTEVWKGALEVMGNKLEIIFNVTSKAGETTIKMDVPAQGAKDIPVVVHLHSADSVSYAIPMLTIEYSGKRQGSVIKGKFKQGGMTFPLDLKKIQATAPKRPQTPRTPLGYEVREVTFGSAQENSGGVTLSGTLSLPVGYDGTTKPPVVLMVTGSGPQDRDEAVFGHRPFAVLADYLARHGIATLRYDDRGVGESTGRFQGSTTADFVEDARGGLGYLRGLDLFGTVGILGHSEGGMIALALGHGGWADFVVAMAAPGVKGKEILRDQMATKAEQMGAGELTEDFFAEQWERIKGEPWMDYFLAYDPKDDISSVTVPAMALYGALDKQVRASVNASAVRRYLPAHPLHKINVYDGLNHLFQHANTGYVEEYYQIEETISPRVMDDVVQWIASVTASK